MELGERIRSLRDSTDMSARELDALAGLTPGHTRFIETGRVKLVRADTVRKIRLVFDVPYAWLFGGEGPEPNFRKIAASVAAARARRPTGKVASG